MVKDEFFTSADDEGALAEDEGALDAGKSIVRPRGARGIDSAPGNAVGGCTIEKRVAGVD